MGWRAIHTLTPGNVVVLLQRLSGVELTEEEACDARAMIVSRRARADQLRSLRAEVILEVARNANFLLSYRIPIARAVVVIENARAVIEKIDAELGALST